MPYEDLYGVYPVKNVELKSVAEFAYEVAYTVSSEQSAGATMGLDEHAMGRQRQYLENVRARVTALADRPIPDLPATHPILFNCDLSAMPPSMGVAGKTLNSDAEAVATLWMQFAYELVKSNSAGLGGGLTSFDAKRAVQNVDAIDQFLASIEAAAEVDFPETAAPEATAQPRSKTSR